MTTETPYGWEGARGNRYKNFQGGFRAYAKLGGNYWVYEIHNAAQVVVHTGRCRRLGDADIDIGKWVQANKQKEGVEW